MVRCIKVFGVGYQKVRTDVALRTRLASLIADGFDIGLGLHTSAILGNARMMSRHLLDFKWAIYGRRDDLEEMGPVDDMGDLKGHGVALHSLVDFCNQPRQVAGDAVPVIIPRLKKELLVRSLAQEVISVMTSGRASCWTMENYSILPVCVAWRV